jgi:small GTP-binding protein
MWTMGIDMRKHAIAVEGAEYLLQIFDTAGQERFRTLTLQFYRGAEGILLVFDVCRRESFSSAQYWLNEILENAGKGACLLLVGNKCDCTEQRVVSRKEAATFASKHSIEYIETSAKEGTNVQAAFARLAKTVGRGEPANTQPGDRVGLHRKRKERGCCRI